MNTAGKTTLHRMSTVGMALLSAAALAVVLPLWYGMLTGHVPLPQGDEGTSAHIFQLCVALLLPIGVVFLVTADWTRPVHAVRRAALPGIFVVLAFSTVFYFEHVYSASHGLPAPRPGWPLLLLRRILSAVG